MDDKIIDIEAEVTSVEDPKVETKEPTDEMVKQIKEMNEQASTKEGSWIWADGIGLVWQPGLRDTSEPAPGVPSPSSPPILLESLVKWGNEIDFDHITENAVVLIKLNVDEPLHLQLMQNAIIKQVLNPRIEKLKEKKVCVLFMRAGDDISIMTEEDMNKAGWTKTNKSLIINPFDL
jgi:hypothetical protein